jgi:hypothetical protein
MNLPDEVIDFLFKIIITDLSLITFYRDVALINYKFYNVGLQYLYEVNRRFNENFVGGKIYYFLHNLGDNLKYVIHVDMRSDFSYYDILSIQCQYCKDEYKKTRIATVRDCVGGCDNCHKLIKQ